MLGCSGIVLAVLVQVPARDAQEPRRSALALGLDYVRAGRAPRKAEVAEVDRDGLLPRVLEQEQRIATEIAALGEHEWAGVYAQGDGFSTVTLSVAPQAGATYVQSGCMVYDLNLGTIAAVTRDGIELELAVDPARNDTWYQAYCPHPSLSERWVPVPWGDARYLVADSQLIAFCNDVNDGDDFVSYPRRVDARQPVSRSFQLPQGLPRVPAPYGEFLLARPLTTQIGATSPREKLGTFSCEDLYLVSASVDIGLADGLLPGMFLYPSEPDHSGTGEVVEVGPHHATVEFRFVPTDEDVPEVGWLLSTSNQKSPESVQGSRPR